MSATGKKTWIKVLRVLFVAASLALLYYLLHRVGWARISEYSVRLGWSGAVLILGLGYLHSFLGGLALRKSITEEVSFLYVHVTNQAGGVVNRLVPWDAGEILKVTLLSQRTSSKAAISGTIVWNYVMKLSKPIATLLSSTIAWMFGSPEMSDLALWMMLASVISFAPYIIFRLLVHFGLANMVTRLLRLLRVIRKDPQKTIEKAKEIDTVVRTFSKTHRWAYFQILFLQFAGFFVSWVIVYAVLRFLGYEYDFATTGLIWTGFAVMAYLVGLLPSRLGTTEASGWVLFELLGLDPAVGLMVQCILTLRTIVVSGSTALLIFAFPSLKK